MPKVSRDANQPEIIDALQRAGCSVVDLAAVGGGVYDLLVARRNRTMLIEVKTASGRLRESQIRFAQTWRGRLGVARTPIEAVQLAEKFL